MGKHHGMSRTNTYYSWQTMIQRCTNPTNPNYKYYGARAITVCNEWLNSFPNFVRDMGKRPINMSLDRIDNNKGYYKENCRWAVLNIQVRNRRSNRFIVFEGLKKSVVEWAEFLGIYDKKTFNNRICTLDWSLTKAATTPIRRYDV